MGSALSESGTKTVPQKVPFYGRSNGAPWVPFWCHLFFECIIFSICLACWTFSTSWVRRGNNISEVSKCPPTLANNVNRNYCVPVSMILHELWRTEPMEILWTGIVLHCDQSQRALVEENWFRFFAGYFIRRIRSSVHREMAKQFCRALSSASSLDDCSAALLFTMSAHWDWLCSIIIINVIQLGSPKDIPKALFRSPQDG